MLAAYDAEVRLSLARRLPAGWSASWDGPLLRCTTPHAGFVSYRSLSSLSSDELDALIGRTVAFYAERGEKFEWKTHGHDWPPDLAQRLTRSGFVAEPRETVVIGSVAQIATEPVLPSGVRLREVDSDQDLRRIAAMESEVWAADWSWLADDLISRVRSDPELITVLVAETDSAELVSAAWLVRNPGTAFGALWGGSTLAAWRGRGIYRALVGRRAQLAQADGLRYLQVDASDDSRPILLRLGFEAVTTTTPYLWSPPSVSVRAAK
ncbi:hypothetical protein SAMN05892883_0269 [Jatrophihabitans sp. GAS493]|uniref:GNAT family N-acetyltransferase n=1 Tax=Jatrophihabitans sp. GAS493 TaxID=1907575 RepID=UPI000BB94A88|nr:GNAT family N-acetyltransferase [Jatrophihabitans sp. GAS493]SOD70586.1 hypothetical protein SAMN05892883_0269 [Jatrophihabitans sp. GAS493]